MIPLFNHASYIENALSSALRQGPLLHEVLVIDDGSTDESAEIARRIATSDPRIFVWSQPNRGAHAAINTGLSLSRGDLVAILNSDDAFHDDRLSVLVDALDAQPWVSMVASGIEFINAKGTAGENPWFEKALDFYRQSRDLPLALVNGNFLMTTSNYLFRRSLFDSVGGFAPLRYAHDLEFALRILAAGHEITWLPQSLVRYRLHAGNTIKEEHARVRLEWAAVTAFYLNTVWGQPGGTPDWERLRRFENVMEAHKLSQAVHLCQSYFAMSRACSFDRSGFVADAAFRRFVSSFL